MRFFSLASELNPTKHIFVKIAFQNESYKLFYQEDAIRLPEKTRLPIPF